MVIGQKKQDPKVFFAWPLIFWKLDAQSLEPLKIYMYLYQRSVWLDEIDMRCNKIFWARLVV